MKISPLVCGHGKTEGIAKVALDQLASSVDLFSGRAIKFLKRQTTADTLNFGPFCARAFLENACAALVGRLDSFRMLYLSEFQAQSDYELGRRAKSAFSWAGDVMPMEDRPNQAMWRSELETPKINRALFSKYVEHMYWKPALEAMIDFLSPSLNDPIFSEIASIDTERYISEARGHCSQLYSSLSKGVHWEFFTSALVFDDATVKSLIRESCLVVAVLGLASHFIPTAYASLPKEKAAKMYASFRREIP